MFELVSAACPVVEINAEQIQSRIKKHPAVIKGWHDSPEQLQKSGQRLSVRSGMGLAGIAGSAHDTGLPDRVYHITNGQTCSYKFLDSFCLCQL